MDKTTTDTAKQIGEKIKAVRLQRGLTQAEVAKKAELSANYYARVERGDTNVTVDALQKITTALRARSADILPF